MTDCYAFLFKLEVSIILILSYYHTYVARNLATAMGFQLPFSFRSYHFWLPFVPFY